MKRHEIRVELGKRSYTVHISGTLDAPSLRAVLAGRRAFIVSDRHVAACHLQELKQSLGQNCGVHLIKPGERSKSLAVAEALYTALAKWGADRRTCLIALGGGVVGDLAGFVAATYMRGIPFIQIPTSLLAMVDSSVGGKVAVDHPRGKNLIGCFYQPESVWIAVGLLKTLPRRELSAGLAEVLKYGLIRDAKFFAWLEANLDNILALEPAALTHAIATSVRIKAGVVSKDEFETTGLRSILNFGHTFAHAEELLSGYQGILHGEAVAAGMVAALRLGAAVGPMQAARAAQLTARLVALLEKAKLPVRLQHAGNFEAFFRAMQGDKKAEAGRVRFVLLKALGRAGLPREVEEKAVAGVLRHTTQD